ncbi:hypothetical protein [Candidatus Electrothrix sp.]|uniref:hypothetical protein n=1 Tax=Candidatus Electrothrix sp. TaxID=2170559 RepID=UPI0040567663
MSNHDKTLPNDDKIIIHRHDFLPLNDSDEVQDAAKQVQHRPAPEKNHADLSQDGKDLMFCHD